MNVPVVTGDAVYACNTTGKLFAFDRKSGAILATYPLSPGKEVFSSPSAAGS